MKKTTKYEDRIKRLIKDTTEIQDLSKHVSDSIVSTECPTCEYGYRCLISLKGKYQICRKRSTESHIVRIRVSNINIDVNDRFGVLTIVKYNGKEKGRSSWYCLCDCGSLVIVREDHLLDGNTTSCGCRKGKRLGQSYDISIDSKKIRKYRIGSSRNPDGTPHVYPAEHSSRVGMSLWVDIVGKDGTARAQIVTCKACESPIRKDNLGDKVCENEKCGLIAGG